jgi:hypothetical protein
MEAQLGSTLDQLEDRQDVVLSIGSTSNILSRKTLCAAGLHGLARTPIVAAVLPGV